MYGYCLLSAFVQSVYVLIDIYLRKNWLGIWESGLKILLSTLRINSSVQQTPFTVAVGTKKNVFSVDDASSRNLNQGRARLVLPFPHSPLLRWHHVGAWVGRWEHSTCFSCVFWSCVTHFHPLSVEKINMLALNSGVPSPNSYHQPPYSPVWRDWEDHWRQIKSKCCYICI